MPTTARTPGPRSTRLTEAPVLTRVVASARRLRGRRARSVAALLGLVAAAAVVPLGTAGASTVSSPSDGFTFIVSNGDLTLTGCDGACPTALTIPSSIGGDPVTAIGDGAFRQVGLTSVTIPDSVTSIGADAFFNNSIAAVSIPNSVTAIGSSSFASNAMGAVTIGDSVTSIGTNAFEDDNLTSVAIPNSVLTLGDSAFQFNNNLTSAAIGDSVTSIGGGAFEDDDLASVSIPNSVTTIGAGAFSYNPNLDSATIGDSVTTIGDQAFFNANLSAVTIPDSVTSIGAGAFEDNLLSTVAIPNSVVSVGDYAFSQNLNLSSVTVGDTVASIGSGAFANNYLSSVTFLGAPPTFGSGAFSGTAGSPAYYPASIPSWTAEASAVAPLTLTPEAGATTLAPRAVGPFGAELAASLANPVADVVTGAQFCLSTAPFVSGACPGARVPASGTTTPSADVPVRPATTYYVEFEAFDSTSSLPLDGGVVAFTTPAFHPPAAPQAPLSVTTTSAIAGTPLTLVASGGSGTGALTFTLVEAGSAGCALSGDVLSATGPGTCVVSAAKAGDATFAPATSPPTTVTVTAPPPPPTTTTTVPRPEITRVLGVARVGRTVSVRVLGVGLEGRPRLTLDEPGASLILTRDDGTVLVVRVRVRAGAATGWRVLTVELAGIQLRARLRVV